MDELERRYRRWLRWYPADHRAVHQDEMVAVLLTDAGAGQRRPDARTVLDLVVGGLRLHARRMLPRTPQWRRAVALAQLCAPLAMLVIVGSRLNLLMPAPVKMELTVFGALDIVWDAGWILVAERVLMGRSRRNTALAAWCLVAWNVGSIWPVNGGGMVAMFVANGWTLLLGVLAAASLSVPTGRAPLSVLPGRHRLLVPASLVGAGAIAAAGAGWLVYTDDPIAYVVLLTFLVAGVAGLAGGPVARRCTLLLGIPYAGSVVAGLATNGAFWRSLDVPAAVSGLGDTVLASVDRPASLMVPLVLGFAGVYGLYGLGRLVRVIRAGG